MDELKIYLDNECKNEIKEYIEFGEVVAGEKSTSTIFLKNMINYPINTEIILEGENISIVQEIRRINPNEIKEINFNIEPKITTMKPIKANIQIKINYVIR